MGAISAYRVSFNDRSGIKISSTSNRCSKNNQRQSLGNRHDTNDQPQMSNYKDARKTKPMCQYLSTTAIEETE